MDRPYWIVSAADQPYTLKLQTWAKVVEFLGTLVDPAAASIIRVNPKKPDPNPSPPVTKLFKKGR